METGHPSARAVNSGSGNRALVIVVSAVLVLSCAQTDTHTDRQTRMNAILSRLSSASVMKTNKREFSYNTRKKTKTNESFQRSGVSALS